MDEFFDPYHKWLGIPPKDQPPNHYRLLGIELFESDADVIDNAADQRMTHVKTFQTGKRFELSQIMLNEIAAARDCLLKIEKKLHYDSELYSAEPPPLATPTTAQLQKTPPPVSVVSAPVALIRPELAPRRARSPVSVRSHSRRQSRQKWAVGLGLAAAAAGGMLLLAFLPAGEAANEPTRKSPPNKNVAAPPQRAALSKPSVDSITSNSGASPEAAPPPVQPDETPPDPLEQLFDKIERAIAEDKLAKTPAAGGRRGGPFTDPPKEPRLLVGLKATVSPYFGGRPTIKSIKPVYQSREGINEGMRIGQPYRKEHAILAREGYAVGGIVAKSGLRLDGYRVIFMRITAGGLDKSDTYKSGWLGGKGGGKEIRYAGHGRPIVGVYGRHGSDIDSLGFLVVDQQR